VKEITINLIESQNNSYYQKSLVDNLFNVSMELCIRCNELKSMTKSNPYCSICWRIVQGNLLQIPPIKVLSVINNNMTYQEIMSHLTIKPYFKKSSLSVCIGLRKLLRLRLVQVKPNRMYSITDLGKMVLSEIKS